MDVAMGVTRLSANAEHSESPARGAAHAPAYGPGLAGERARSERGDRELN